jgi:hypothetical protein
MATGRPSFTSLGFGVGKKQASNTSMTTSFDSSNSHTSSSGGGGGPQHPQLQRFQWLIAFRQLRIQNIIGSGASGQVCKGLYDGLPVAIKRISISQFDDAGAIAFDAGGTDSDYAMAVALKDVKTEANTMTSIVHPNLLRFFGVSITRKDIYLVRQVQLWLESDPFPLHNACLIRMLGNRAHVGQFRRSDIQKATPVQTQTQTQSHSFGNKNATCSARCWHPRQCQFQRQCRI